MASFLSRKQERKNSSGFTVIEMVLVLTMLSALSFGVLMFMQPMVNLMTMKYFVEGPQAEGRLALKRMTREISQLRDPQSILIANGSQYSFIDSSNNTITYNLSSGNLQRNSIVMAKSISNLQFTYYDSGNSALGTPVLSPETNIARVQMALTVTVGANAATYRAQSRPRNLVV